MAPSQTARKHRPANPTSPPNTAWTGVVLVVVAVVVGIFLLAKGGGTAPIDANAGRSPAAVATDKNPGGTTTSAPVVATPLGQLKVLVSNGSGTPGRGNTVSSQLISLGYTQANAKNGTKATNQKSAVFFVPGAEADAQAVAAALKLAPTQVAALPPAIPLAKPAELGDSTVLVLVGADFPGLSK